MIITVTFVITKSWKQLKYHKSRMINNCNMFIQWNTIPSVKKKQITDTSKMAESHKIWVRKPDIKSYKITIWFFIKMMIKTQVRAWLRMIKSKQWFSRGSGRWEVRKVGGVDWLGWGCGGAVWHNGNVGTKLVGWWLHEGNIYSRSSACFKVWGVFLLMFDYMNYWYILNANLYQFSGWRFSFSRWFISLCKSFLVWSGLVCLFYFPCLRSILPLPNHLDRCQRMYCLCFLLVVLGLTFKKE